MGKAHIVLVAVMLFSCSSGGTDDKTPIIVIEDMSTTDAAVDLAEPDEGMALAQGSLVLKPTRLQMNENGGTGTFNVALAVKPASDVMVTIESSDTSEASVRPESLVFTPQDWSTEQTVMVTGVDDDCCDGTRTIDIIVRGYGEENYADTSPAVVTVDVLDDDLAGGSVSPLAVTAWEGGPNATFDVVLSGHFGCDDDTPRGPVRIPVSASDPSQITVDVDELVFTSENFDTPQTVVVSAVDDSAAELEEMYTVVLGAATGGGYDGFDPADVQVTVISDDDPIVAVVPQLHTTSESGTTSTFDVSLSPAPTLPVVLEATVGDLTEGTIQPMNVTFDGANPGPHTFTVTGLDDALCDGDQTYQIEFTTTSSDTWFDGLTVPPVTVTNREDDGCGTATVAPQSLTLLEGESGTFTIVLSTDPGEVVTVDLTSSSPGDASVAPPTLTFDSTNFGTPQVVTVTAGQNTVVDGNRSVIIDTVMNATLGYALTDPANVAVLVIDDD